MCFQLEEEFNLVRSAGVTLKQFCQQIGVKKQGDLALGFVFDNLLTTSADSEIYLQLYHKNKFSPRSGFKADPG